MLFDTAFAPLPVATFHRDVARFLDSVVEGADAGWLPSVDVRETESEITLALELPGVPASDIQITTDQGVLTVRGTKRRASEREDKASRYHMTERTYGAFVRSFRLPKGVDESRISASCENGVLLLTVPKAAIPQPRRIEIAGAAVDKQVGASDENR